MLSLDYFSQLVNCKITVAVFIDLFEGLSQSVNLLLWQLRCDVCHYDCFES